MKMTDKSAKQIDLAINEIVVSVSAKFQFNFNPYLHGGGRAYLSLGLGVEGDEINNVT